jgi:hypothetical protein
VVVVSPAASRHTSGRRCECEGDWHRNSTRDNRGDRRATAAASALFPGPNPIELSFAKLKAHLRKAGEPSIPALLDRIGTITQRVREAAKAFGLALEVELPDGPDKTWAIRNHRTTAMWANVAMTRQADDTPRKD